MEPLKYNALDRKEEFKKIGKALTVHRGGIISNAEMIVRLSYAVKRLAHELGAPVPELDGITLPERSNIPV